MSAVGRRILVLTPGHINEVGAAAPIVAAAQRCGVDAQLLSPASENALRKQLASGDVGFVYLMTGVKSRAAADHIAVDFDSSTGTSIRAVNLRHLARTLAQAGTPCTVLLQPNTDTGDLGAAADILVRNGATAAIVWPAMSSEYLAAAAERLFLQWSRGAPLAVIAATAETGDGVSFAGASAVDVGPAMHAVPSADRAPAGVPAPQVVAAPAAAVLLDPGEGVAHQLAAKRKAGRFDVFLCHNRADKPAVREIARALRTRGIMPWLDEWELPPGKPWQPLLEKQIESIASAAVCVGGAGVGPWQEQELYGFLREFVSRKAPVIPVLLPDAPQAPKLPIFLRAMTWVDFRQTEPDPIVQLEWGITGVRPAFA